MKYLLDDMRHRLARLHEDETGAEEGMNKLLIFALIALPLLALLLFFGDKIVEFASGAWDDTVGDDGKGVKPGKTR